MPLPRLTGRIMIAIALLALIGGAGSFFVFAATGSNPIQSQSLINFELNVPLASANITGSEIKDGTAIGIYIKAVYEFLVRAAAILAVMMFSYGGLLWLTAAGEKGRVGEAQKVMTNALVGLVLALGSYTILYTINPKLKDPSNVNPRLIAAKPIHLTVPGRTQQVVNGAISPLIFKRAKKNTLNECIDLINRKRLISSLIVNVPIFFCKGTYTSAQIIDCWASQSNIGDNAIAASCTNMVDLSATPLNQSAPPDTTEGVCCYKDALPTP